MDVIGSRTQEDKWRSKVNFLKHLSGFYCKVPYLVQWLVSCVKIYHFILFYCFHSNLLLECPSIDLCYLGMPRLHLGRKKYNFQNFCSGSLTILGGESVLPCAPLNNCMWVISRQAQSYIFSIKLPPILHVFECFWQYIVVLEYIYFAFKTTHFTQTFHTCFEKKIFSFSLLNWNYALFFVHWLNFFAGNNTPKQPILCEVSSEILFCWYYSKILPILCVFSPIYPPILCTDSSTPFSRKKVPFSHRFLYAHGNTL